MAIYKRENSKFYWFKFHFGGELIQRSSKSTNIKDAKLAESEHYKKLLRGELNALPKPKAPGFDVAADEFLSFLRVQKDDGGTYRRNLYGAKSLKAFFGKKKADQIAARDVEQFIVWRKNQRSVKTGESVSNDTVNKELSILSRILRRLKKAGFISQNPADDVAHQPANAPTFHVITPNEEKIYLMACPPLLQDVATLMIEGGFRCGEVYNLEKKDFRPEKNFVQIASGKTKAARRRVYLTEKAKAVLIRRAAKFAGAYLFPHFDKDGNPPTRSLSYVHAEVIEKLGFSFRVYDCRHTFASRAVESGIDLVTLAAILGHTNLKMLTRYCHPSETNKYNAILRMEKLAKAV